MRGGVQTLGRGLVGGAGCRTGEGERGAGKRSKAVVSGAWREGERSGKWHREEAWCQREGVREGAEPGLRGVNKQAGRDAAVGRGLGLQRGVGRGYERRRDQVRPGPEVEVGPGFGGVTG